jgi:hypothetical protein
MRGPGQRRLHRRPGPSTCPTWPRSAFRWPRCRPTAAAVITKLAGTGGRVDRLTCTAQLLYEIEDPARYLQPDVVADFSQVRLQEARPDRVQATGASGQARPDAAEGHAGLPRRLHRRRPDLLRRPGRPRARRAGAGGAGAPPAALGWADLEHRAELIGVNAMHGPGPGRRPRTLRGAAAPGRALRHPRAGRTVGQEVEALYLNGPAAGGGVTQSVREVVAVASALVPRAAVRIANATCWSWRHEAAVTSPSPAPATRATAPRSA